MPPTAAPGTAADSAAHTAGRGDVVLSQVTKTFGSMTAVRDLDLEV